MMNFYYDIEEIKQRIKIHNNNNNEKEEWEIKKHNEKLYKISIDE